MRYQAAPRSDTLKMLGCVIPAGAIYARMSWETTPPIVKSHETRQSPEFAVQERAEIFQLGQNRAQFLFITGPGPGANVPIPDRARDPIRR